MCERVFKGNIVFSKEFGKIEIIESGYIVVSGKEIVGVYSKLPDKYSDARVFDYGSKLIVPGLIALDLVAPEFGLGPKFEEPTEHRYSELSNKLRVAGITRSVIEGTIYIESNMKLMDTIAKSGLGAFVSNSVADSGNSESKFSLTKIKSDAEEFLIMMSSRYENVKPILSASLSGTCSDELLETIFCISKKHNTKLKLNISDSKLTKKLEGFEENLVLSFDKCCSIDKDSFDQSIFVAVSESLELKPSDIELAVKKGISFGLSSSGISLCKTASSLLDRGFNLGEVLYLATKGGGAFFGKLGSFEEGYEFDALVVASTENTASNSPLKILESFLTSKSDVTVSDIYVAGQKSLGI